MSIERWRLQPLILCCLQAEACAERRIVCGQKGFLQADAAAGLMMPETQDWTNPVGSIK